MNEKNKGVSYVKKTHSQYLQDLHDIGFDNVVVPLEKYINSHTSIIHRWLKCGHECPSSPTNILSRRSGCPICAHNQVIVGVNDIATTHPWVAEMFVNAEDTTKYSYASNKKVDFKCPTCGKILSGLIIFNVVRQGLSCPVCGDGISMPNRFMANVLLRLGVFYQNEKIFDWLPDRRYDFYLPDYSTIIEVNGVQHYFDTSEFKVNLEEQQFIDNMKMETALKNGIEHYIVIDARYSQFEYMRNSICNSELSNLFNVDMLDWGEIYRMCCDSEITKVAKMYRDGMSNTEISKNTGHTTHTITRYLRIATQAGLCNYIGRNQTRKVRCVETNEVFPSVNSARKSVGGGGHDLAKYITTGKPYYGFHWEYAES